MDEQDDYEEEGNLRFVRYVLDYCQEFEDRGCVIKMPHLLNKMSREDFHDMAYTMDSSYRSMNAGKEEL